MTDAGQGSGGSRLARPLEDISLYDIYKAVDTVGDKIQILQDAMESELKSITMLDVMSDLEKDDAFSVKGNNYKLITANRRLEGYMKIHSVSQVMEKMIAFSDGNIHDIDHLIRVWTYAKTIGDLEDLDTDTQYILEVAAITHDIACPLCREKYGNTNGKHQEEEGALMVRTFLSDCAMRTEQIDRIVYLVGHHHTFSGINGIDYQILIEADYIANATENGYGRENVVNFMNRIMKTESGKRLVRAVFCL